MKKLLTLSFLAALAAMILLPLASRAAQSKGDQNGIKVAGTTEGNTGCMILQEHMPVKGKLLFAGVLYARTEYRVVQSFNYEPPKQKFTGQGEIDKLNKLAVKDKVKLVVLPSKYTSDQLKSAKAMCQAKAAGQSGAVSSGTMN